MKANEIKKIAKSLSMESLTAKEVTKHFKRLCDMYGREDAKQIEKAAKEIVKSAAAQRTAQAADARAFLVDGSKVAAAAWSALVKDKDYKDGEPCTRSIVRDSDGVASYVYKVRNLATVGGYLAALKVAISFARRQSIQGAAKVQQMEVCAE